MNVIVTIMTCIVLNVSIQMLKALGIKKDELIAYIVEENLDIICITEMWVNKSQFGDTL